MPQHAVRAAPVAASVARQITLTLNDDELARVNRYAQANTQGDLDRAVSELVRFTVRTWL